MENLLQFLATTAEEILKAPHYNANLQLAGGIGESLSEGRYIDFCCHSHEYTFENWETSELQQLKRYLTSHGVSCSKILTRQGRGGGYGKKYFKIQSDDALRNLSNQIV